MVLISPFGFSPTGEAFNLTMEEVATSVAIALQADKLIFCDRSAWHSLSVPTEPSWRRQPHRHRNAPGRGRKTCLAKEPSATQPTDIGFYLQHCVKACKAGVERSHILPFAVDGVLLLEIYVHDGIGTMVVDERLGKPARSHLGRLGRRVATHRALRATTAPWCGANAPKWNATLATTASSNTMA